MRWWMLTKFTVVIIHNIRKSNHYAVHLKLTLLFSGQVLSNCLQLHGQQPTRILCPWDSPGKNTGVGCCFLLQRIFLTQGLNPGLPHCRQTHYCLSQGTGKVFSNPCSHFHVLLWKPSLHLPWVQRWPLPPLSSQGVVHAELWSHRTPHLFVYIPMSLPLPTDYEPLFLSSFIEV